MSLSSALDNAPLPAHLALLADDWHALRDAVERWQPDLIVTVARRAPRTDEALGLDFSGIATTITDLAVPFAQQFARRARVAVVDDIINVGSTLDNATRMLVQQGAAEVQMFALRSRKTTSELDGVARNVRLVADDSLSADGVDELAQLAPALIARLNKSYDLDFPIMPCRLATPYNDARELFGALVDRFGDGAFDMSTAEGIGRGLHRFTVDWRADDGGFCKARLYYDQVTSQVNVVPMQIVSPLQTEPRADDPEWAPPVRKQLRQALGPVGERDECHARIELFIDSLAFGIRFLQQVSTVVRPAQSNIVSVADAALTFGPAAEAIDVPASVLDLDREPGVTPTEPSSVTSPAFHNLYTAEFRAQVVRASVSPDPISHAIAVIQTLADRVGSERIDEYATAFPFTREEVAENPYRRLRIGFTFNDIVAILQDLAPSSQPRRHWRSTTSKVLDRLIDCGAVVPTIGRFNGRLFRIYRKGEATPREQMADRFLLGVAEYDNPKASATRLTKIGVIVSFVTPSGAAAHVAAEGRGNVLALDGDVIDGSAEMTQFLRRTNRLKFADGTDQRTTTNSPPTSDDRAGG